MSTVETNPMPPAAAVAVAGPNVASNSIAALPALARRIDRVVPALVLFLAFIALVDPALARHTIGHVGAQLAGLAPWFGLSVLFAAGAKATGGDALVARAFVGRESWVIPVAAIVGGLTPFCSCGVIPLVAGLLGAGVPLAPVMAFWIASPLMDPTQFFVIAGTIGIGFAIAKALAAVGMGLLGGYGTMALTRAGLLPLEDALRLTVQPKSCSRSSRKNANAAQPVWRFWEDGERAQVFLTSAATTTWLLVRWLALAFALESVMTAWLPPAVIAQWLGTGPFAIPLAVLVGLPIYINGLAQIPFVAGLIQLGMSPAAALAFMLATTATGFAVLTTLWALVRPKVFALYLAFAILGALIAGYAFQLVLAIV
ncbi:MAG: permease [Pseudolabrys sp.]|nr:permease [Pseudolabrys sp.]